MTVDHAPARDPLALNDEERSVRDTVRDWAQREVAPGAAQRDEEERYDRSLFERAGQLGLTGLPYPEELGGAGHGHLRLGPGGGGDRRGRHGHGGQPLGPHPEPSSASTPTAPRSRSADSCRP